MDTQHGDEDAGIRILGTTPQESKVIPRLTSCTTQYRQVLECWPDLGMLPPLLRLDLRLYRIERFI
jgi:hypothetical protein